MDKLEQVTADLEAQGYVRTDRTIDLKWANIIVLIASIPVLALLIALFFLVNGLDSLGHSNGRTSLIFIVSYIVLVVVHELIHGLTWSIFSPNHWKDIEFGFIKETMTPYCTCCVPLEKGHYILGALMPLIVLGIIPTVIAILTGSFLLLTIAAVMVLSAGGDVLLVIELLKCELPTTCLR